MSALVVRGDARCLPLPDGSVDLIVTSPPYFALRSYTDGGVHYAGQIGSETTPAEYIAALVECTREWMRVLKPSGSIFVNLGDKYNSAASFQQGSPNAASGLKRGGEHWRGREATAGRGRATGAVPVKSLMLLPERYRIACVDELGLIARAVLVWSKPNGLPESVTDRVRRSHEDWVHLVKQPRYFAAVDEIREPHAPDYSRKYPNGQGGQGGNPHRRDGGIVTQRTAADLNPLGKLPGSVWEVATEPLRKVPGIDVDHFAAFPTEWPRRLILGWSPFGVCRACGEGRRPVSERSMGPDAQGRVGAYHGGDSARFAHSVERKMLDGLTLRTITGYACACPDATAPTRPSVVLDPFSGTGTTVHVAAALGRIGIGTDLSADYCRLAASPELADVRLRKVLGLDKPEPVPAGQLELDGVAG